MKYLTESIIVLIILFIITYGILKKVKIYECFIEGVKEGIQVCLRIFPYLLAMLAAVGIFRESGALDGFIELFKPVVNLIGLPAEVIPLAFIKPLSGSGAVGIFTETLHKYGADSFIGRVASILYRFHRNNFLYHFCILWSCSDKKNKAYTLGRHICRFNSFNNGCLSCKNIFLLILL